ncbi:MAG: tetratricopeptide repeat protein [Planctomycetes bacterium]|nr:tetratricopeptide repeat protein [Planctomycetota bacterium]
MHAEQAYIFRHALLQRAAYELQPPSLRARLHGLALEILERLFDPPPPELCAELADHAGYASRAAAGQDQARLLDCELKYLRLAGEQALSGFRPADAIALWRRALDHPRADVRSRMEAALKLSRSLRSASDLRESLAASQRALELARELGDTSRIANALHSTGTVQRDLGLRTESLALLREALATFERLGETRGMAIACGNLALTLSDGGESNETLACFRRAIELCRSAGDLDTEAVQHLNLGATLLELGDYVQAEQELWLADAQFEQLRNVPQRGVVHINLAVIARRRGQKEPALAHISRALELLRQSGYRRMEAQALNVLANYARDDKRHQEARRLYDEVLRIHRDTGNLAVEGRALCSFGSFLLETGELWSAVRTSEAALERLRQTRDALFITSTLGQLAHANLLLGRLDEAEANLHDGFAVERESGLEFMRCQNLMLPLARLELELGHAVKGLPECGECARRIEALAKDPALTGDAVLGRIKGVLDDLKREVEAARAENRLPCIFRGFLPSQLSEATRQAALAAMQEQSPSEFKQWRDANPELFKSMHAGTEGTPTPDWKGAGPAGASS